MDDKTLSWSTAEELPILLDVLTGKLDINIVLGIGVVDIETRKGFAVDGANVEVAVEVTTATDVGLAVVVRGNKVAPNGTLNGSTTKELRGDADDSATSRLSTHMEYRLLEITIPPLPKLFFEDV